MFLVETATLPINFVSHSLVCKIECREQEMADRIWGTVLILVGLLVLLGSIRLVMENWSYSFLLAAALGAVLYLARKTVITSPKPTRRTRL